MTSLVPLGDRALLAYFVGEDAAGRFAARVRRHNPPWLTDVVQAYASVAVFFDLERIDSEQAAGYLHRWDAEDAGPEETAPGKRHHIPCCYDLAPDLDRVARHGGLDREEVIRLHAATEYTVYAIGFCPGFPYLGYLPRPLCGVPRLEEPRLSVPVGSVGLTGRQTGIYTEKRPGGWNLIGRTPLCLVDMASGYFPLRTGDRVRFVRIDEEEFGRLAGERLFSREL
jgi:inhibitor of KinA